MQVQAQLGRLACAKWSLMMTTFRTTILAQTGQATSVRPRPIKKARCTTVVVGRDKSDFPSSETKHKWRNWVKTPRGTHFTVSVGRTIRLENSTEAWVVLGRSDDTIATCLRYCRLARRVAPDPNFAQNKESYNQIYQAVVKSCAANSALVIGVEPRQRSTPPPYPKTRVAGYLILAKNTTPSLRETFPSTSHDSLLFCPFDRGLYSHTCPLCYKPRPVPSLRCDQCGFKI